MQDPGETLEVTIRNEIIRFTNQSPENLKSELNGIPYFDTPVVGFADAHDTLFSDFKDIIGDFHCTPIEVLEKCFPDNRDWQEASVISWVLPISEHTRKSNRRQDKYPSREWSLTRTHGEEFNNILRSHIESFLNKKGITAVAPTLSPVFEVLDSEKNGFSSNWSERHIAYVAGLGTFGLNRALITVKGTAVRFGSVVAGIRLKPTPRKYSNYTEYCLFYQSGKCGACIERCPGDAIGRDGHNKEQCMMHCSTVMEKCSGEDISMPGCGLCQTGVPCENRIPIKRG